MKYHVEHAFVVRFAVFEGGRRGQTWRLRVSDREGSEACQSEDHI